ncbi:MAG: hypothetical protein ACOYD4_11695 [Solirubrobacterales bacterium]
MTSYKSIQRIEDASAIAAHARHRLEQLMAMLDSAHRRGGLSDYNHSAAKEDIEQVSNALWRLQEVLCQFRGGDQ